MILARKRARARLSIDLFAITNAEKIYYSCHGEHKIQTQLNALPQHRRSNNENDYSVYCVYENLKCEKRKLNKNVIHTVRFAIRCVHLFTTSSIWQFYFYYFLIKRCPTQAHTHAVSAVCFDSVCHRLDLWNGQKKKQHETITMRLRACAIIIK